MEYQSCNMNIWYDLPQEVWDKVPEIFQALPGWIGFGDGKQGDEGIPYWFSFNEA